MGSEPAIGGRDNEHGEQGNSSIVQEVSRRAGEYFVSERSISSKNAIAYRARWVVPVARPPISGGVITVAEGRIVAVGQNDSGQPPVDLGDVALLPGMVNAHTHLEFSLLEQPLGYPGIGFSEWIGAVVAWRRSATDFAQIPDRLPSSGQLSAISRGLAESRNVGVCLLGDIATSAGMEEYDACPTIAGVVFHELLSLAQERVKPLLAMAEARLAGHREADSRFIIGLSPHAPYTVHPELLRRACEVSVRYHSPLAMHLAETREELQLLQTHSGPLVERLQSLNAWHPQSLQPGLSAMDYLRSLATAHQSLVIHGNYLTAEEIAFIGANRDRMSVVYCPRTHAYFGHESYPLLQMLEAGVRVAVGTDSRASNPDLDLFAELRLIAAHQPTVSPDDILKMGTLWGAEALGRDRDYGSIAVGKVAALVTLPVGIPRVLDDQTLFASGISPVPLTPPE